MKQANGRTKRISSIWVHIGVWGAYWCWDILMSSWAFSGFLQNSNLLTETFINIFYGTLIFYALLLFALPSKTDRVHALQIIWKVVLTILVCIALRRGCILLMAEWTNFQSPVVTNLKYFFVTSFDIFTQFGIYALLVWFFQKRAALQKQVFQKELQEEKLRHELLEARHAVLKAQISPHFLFNTLSFLYSKTISSGEQALGKTVLLLSDVLRYALEDPTNDGPVVVNNELAHIEKLYEVNHLRFDGRYYFHIVNDGAVYQKKIPPLILLTWFENAMKYGVFDDPQNPVVLHVKQSPNLLEVSMKNKIRDIVPTDNRDQFAIGKRYITTILEQYCKNNYILDYQNDGAFHTVYLKINER